MTPNGTASSCQSSHSGVTSHHRLENTSSMTNRYKDREVTERHERWQSRMAGNVDESHGSCR